jgi:hypothetical protein
MNNDTLLRKMVVPLRTKILHPTFTTFLHFGASPKTQYSLVLQHIIIKECSWI